MDTDKLIEKKIDGELTPAEEKQFAECLKNEPEFAQKYYEYQAAINGLRNHFKQNLRRELEANAHLEPDDDDVPSVLNQSSFRSRLLRYWPAAAAALVLAVGGLWWFRASPVSAEQLAEEFYTVYPVDPVVRGGGNTVDQDSAMLLYQQQRYAAALAYWQQMAPTQQHGQVALWLGHCYWQTGQLPRAIESFQQARQSDDAIVRQHAAWYLSLAYLRQGEVKTALPILRQMQQEGTIYQREVNELLTKLK